MPYMHKGLKNVLIMAYIPYIRHFIALIMKVLSCGKKSLWGFELDSIRNLQHIVQLSLSSPLVNS